MTTVKIALSLGLFLATALSVLAEPKTFRNEGLKNEIVVRLDVQGKKVSGTYASAEYGEEAVPRAFSGEVVPAPKGKRGVYMQVRFEDDIPYSPPPDAKVLRWYLKIVDHRAHLFIPMQERSYTGKTPKWVVSDVEFLPD